LSFGPVDQANEPAETQGFNTDFYNAFKSASSLFSKPLFANKETSKSKFGFEFNEEQEDDDDDDEITFAHPQQNLFGRGGGRRTANDASEQEEDEDDDDDIAMSPFKAPGSLFGGGSFFGSSKKEGRY